MRFFNKHKVLVICFLYTALALFFCSKNSFLYIRNDWTDENIYMTIARGLHEGKVLYKELFDHKGPLLYLVYYFISFLSMDYWILYVLEVVSYTCFVYYSYKTVMLYLTINDKHFGLFFIAIVSFVPVVTSGFFMGGSLEELALPLLMIPLYWMLESVRVHAWLSDTKIVFIGLFCGLCFWMKYTLCGFFFGMCLFVIYYNCKYRHLLLRDIFLFLVGFLIITFFVLFYCSESGCLYEMFHVYFYENIFKYSGNISRIQNTNYLFCKNICTFCENHQPVCISLLGSFVFWAYDRRLSLIRLLLLFTFIGLFFSTIIFGVSFLYYGFIFNIYLFVGYVILVRSLKYFDVVKFCPKGVMYCCVVILCLNALFGNKNLYYLQYNDGSDPQTIFSNIIWDDMPNERPFVLQYGYLDMGFMKACNSVIPSPYFCYVNLRADDIFKFHKDLIKDKVPDYVIIADFDLSPNTTSYPTVDLSGYKLRKYMRFKYWYNQDGDYYLYERS